MRRPWHLASLLLLVVPIVPARAATPESGRWLTQDASSVIAIEDCATGLCGRIVGISLDHPTDPPPKNIWGGTQCKELIIDMPRHGPDGRWHGTILDPRSGHSWSAQLWRRGDVLQLHGYLGLPLFGITQSWTPFAGTLAPNCAFKP